MKQIKLFKLLFPFLLLNIVSAATLKEAVEHALANNPEVQSIQINSQAYKLYIDEEEAGYYPTLDLDVYVENKKENKQLKDNPQTHITKEGYNAQLKLEQMIYDGGLTDASVDEAKYNYQKTKIANMFTIESIIFETVQAYMDNVKYKELLILSKNNMDIHNSYLEIAKQSEEASGEALDRLQVESKLFLATSKYYQQKNDNEVSQNAFFKLVGYDSEGIICRPILKDELIPSSVKEANLFSVKNNLTVLEKIEEIKVQRAIISQEKSRFLPTLKFKMTEEFDDDLDLKDSKSDSTSVQILLSYNIFNGGSDNASKQREIIFLKESQKILDDTMNLVEEDIKNSYSDYINSREKINYLKLYVEKNKEILKIYKEQFSGGTRTFIDILNSEAELFNAKSQLIEEEYSLLNSYYEILLILSKLSDTIVLQDNQVCKELVVDLDPQPDLDLKNEDDDDLSELEELLEDDTTQESQINEEDKKDQLVKDLLADILNDVYKIKEMQVVKKKKQDIEIEPKIKKEIQKQSNTAADEVKDKTDAISDTPETKLDKSKSNIKEEKQSTEIVKETQKINEIIKDIDRFIEAYGNNYTINLKSFTSQQEAISFISSNEVLSNSLILNFGDDEKYVKVISGVYIKYEDAALALEKINKTIESDIFIVDSIKNLKRLSTTSIYLDEKHIEPKENIVEETTEIPEIPQSKESPEYRVMEEIINNKDNQLNFINANENHFTINISTFTSTKELYAFIEKHELANKAFAFRFKNNAQLIKLTFGLYPSIELAQNDLKKISEIENVHAVIQKVQDVKKLFDENEINNDGADKKVIESNILIDDETIEKDKEDKNIDIDQTIEINEVNPKVKTTEETLSLSGTPDIIKDEEVVSEIVQEVKPDSITLNKKLDNETVEQDIDEKQKEEDTIKIQTSVVQVQKSDEETKQTNNSELEIEEIIEYVNGSYFPNLEYEEYFFNKELKKYTIAVTTSPSFKDAKVFRNRHEISHEAIVYKFRNKAKVIYGIYDSAQEATNVIENFDRRLKRLKPFVNRLRVHRKLYEKYNKKIED